MKWLETKDGFVNINKIIYLSVRKRGEKIKLAAVNETYEFTVGTYDKEKDAYKKLFSIIKDTKMLDDIEVSENAG